MLKARVITALVLLAVILPVLFAGSIQAVHILCTLFFAAACWESCRLFEHRYSIAITVALTGIYFIAGPPDFWAPITLAFFALIVILILFIPSLKFGLPKPGGFLNFLFSFSYIICLFSCFLGIEVLYSFSIADPKKGVFLLLSFLAIVWVADIGAYFVGKAFGRRLLAPSISPGKTWEGAIGGWIGVLIYGMICADTTFFSKTPSFSMPSLIGFASLVAVLTVLTVFSVVGDLFESQLKRRANRKDSSALLPGHGGVLDRIDSLIFVLPSAFLLFMMASLGGM